MRPRSIFFYNRANSEKIRMLAKVWKVQVRLTCGYYLKEINTNVETVKWTIYKVLN